MSRSRLLRTIQPAGLLSRCAAVTGSPHGGMTRHGQWQRELRSDTWKVLSAMANHSEEQLHLWKHLCGGQIRSFWWAGRTAKITCPSPGLPEHSVVVLGGRSRMTCSASFLQSNRCFLLMAPLNYCYYYCQYFMDSANRENFPWSRGFPESKLHR